jgi:DNA polymerase-1
MTIKYLSADLSTVWGCDIEGNDLYPAVTKVWCLTAVNAKTKQEIRLRNPELIKAWVTSRVLEGHYLVFHNGLGYDGPTLNKVLSTTLTVANIIDTMIMSMIYSPSLAGGHSLEAWGNRLNYPKGDWSDFSQWSQGQEDYCLRDSHLCLRVYLELRRRMLEVGFTERGIELEHRSWALIQIQKRNGFYFAYEEALVLYAKIREIEKELEREIHEYWPPQLTRVFTGKQSRKKDGSDTQNFKRHLEQYDDVRRRDDGSYDCYSYVSFNVGSPPQRVERLLELGWKPLEFTKPSKSHPKGQPQPVIKGKLSPSLEAFVEKSDHQGARLIAKWIDYNARGNMINTWMESYNEHTHAIHGSLWFANTLRYRHSNPNTANIPAVRVSKTDESPLKGTDGVFTYESRDLWRCRDPRTRLLVGVDAKGIQLRVLAQYLNNDKFTEAVVGGDPHSYNQEVGGFTTRAVAKTFIYAFLLGAGDEKVGQIIGGSKRDGGEIKKRFISNFPGLADLLHYLARQVERTRRIVLCDGTPIIVSSPHTRLGYLLQGDESRIMKQASIYSSSLIYRRKLDVLKVGDIHDEWQSDVFKDHVEELRQDVYPIAFARAGNSFNYRVPIECDSKVGRTWAETH